MMNTVTLELMRETLAVCKLPANADVPDWLPNTGFVSLTRTPEELSIVCDQDVLPDDLEKGADWRAIKVQGQLDFALTGILSSIASPLADANISIFAISTFDTDYVLVQQSALDSAVKVLQDVGHTVVSL